jgi:redox-sensitive bicupin YhaK (pirin superfamily)
MFKMTETLLQPRVRPAATRGHADHGWLRSAHSFSFSDYFDAERVQFGSLRVINDDVIAGGTGFGMHGHRDMEIITYMLEGELMHKDSMGNGSVIRPGDVQRMSAGTGVMHSEFNHSRDLQAHLLQIWILPATASLKPSYEQRFYPDQDKRGRLRLVASPDGRDASVVVHQDVTIYAGLINGAETAVHALAPARQAYLHVARGALRVNGLSLAAGDAATFDEAGEIVVDGGADAEILLFDLAA